jgi:hypothetical protein
MFKHLARLALLITCIIFLYRLTPTTPSSAALDASATPTVRPSATVPPTRTLAASPTAAATRTRYPTRTVTLTRTASPTASPTFTASPTATATSTATPASPYAWMDAAQTLSAFSPIAPIVLHFSVPMDIASTGGEPALLTFPWVEGEAAWADDDTTLTFQPAAQLKGGQSYHIYINPKLITATGENLGGSTDWQLTAAHGPQVIAHSSQPGRLLNTSLTFNRPMDADSVATALGMQPALPISLTWQADTLIITSAEGLTPGQQLAFTLSASATAADGVQMEDAYAWSVAAPAFTAYTFRSSGETEIVIAFSEAMDRQRVETALTISPTISGTLGWDDDFTLRLTPTNAMDTWGTAVIYFKDELLDKDGRPLPTLAPITYVPPPPIANSEYVVADTVTDTIEIQFTAPVDRASAEAAFEMVPPVEGSFTWNENTLVFQPALPLQGDGWNRSAYTVRLSPVLKTQHGRVILRNEIEIACYVDGMSFKSGFGERGPNIQVVDSLGPRVIQFQSAEEEKFIFSLYRFDLATFITRYRDYFTIHVDLQKGTIPTTDGELTAQWTWLREEMNPRADVPELYLPADVPPGLYVLDMQNADGDSVGQLFVVLTENALMVKRAGNELLIWVTDSSGESIPNIEVRLYSKKGEKIRTGQTDADGLYRTTIPEGYEPLLVVARTPQNEFAITGLEGVWGDYSYWGWWIGGATAPQPLPYRIYPYTDRPIYRPGQTVNFKAIVRAERDVKYTLPPAGTPITVRVRDARDNIIQTFSLATNDFGSVNGAVVLSDGAMTGSYTIEASIAQTSFRQPFKVQDYRKPEIQVSISTDAAQYVVGDPFTLTVQADYFFGEPVANATVTIKKYRLQKNYCWWEACASENDWLWFPFEGAGKSAKTDANGQFVFSDKAVYDDWYLFYDPDSWYGNARSVAWGYEVTLDDGSGQVVSAYTIQRVYNVAEKFTLVSGTGLKATGKPITITAQAIKINGEPLAGRAMTLSISRWDGNYTPVISPTLLTTDATGQVQTTFTPTLSGYYQLNLAGSDSRGNEVRYNRYVYVYTPGDPWASRLTYDQLSISAAQSETRPYETVQLLIESGFDGPALLTFERGRVNRVKPITLTPPLTVVEVEIIPEDAPNIFITVNAWKEQPLYPPEGEEGNWGHYYFWENSWADQKLLRATVNLTVDASDKALNVSIVSDQATYTPRQSATFTMTVANAQGQPVEAELSLALVDEAIYALSDELAPPIFQHFYGPRPNSTNTFNSYAPYRVIVVAGRGGGGGSDDIGLSPRADFPDTALWIPAITTDKNGVATVTVNLPDNLTTWRVVVRAVTKSTLVGEATHKVITQQPVVIRPQLPRVLTVGDAVTLSAFVHNYTAGPLDLFTSVQVSDASVAISGTALIPVSLAAGEVKLVEWAANVLAAGEPQVTFATFQMPVVDRGRVAWTVGDAVQLPLTIQPLAVPEIAAETGSFAGEYNTIIPLPPDALSLSTVRLELSRTVAGSLLEGLEYLTGYPYGCVEQTMSRALPNAVVGRAFEKLAAGDAGRKEALEPLIRASVQRLYGYQHNDGGWGWWYDDATDAYQTAWVVFGLTVTAEAGYEIDPQVIARGADWLRQHLAEMDIRTRAYALYSMAVAGHGDRAATDALNAASLRELDPFSQAALALAYHELGADEPARAILAVLATTATQKDGLAYWPQPSGDGHYHAKTMSSTTRTTALVLGAFVQIDPQNELIPGAVAWLMDQRQPYGWGSTNETSYAILALTDHLQAVQERLVATDLQIEINGSVLMTATIAVQQPMLNVDIPFDRLQAGVNHLSVRQIGGEGEVYYRLIQRVYLSQTEVPAAGPVSIQREYLDPQTKKPIEQVAAGDLVLVRLTVNLSEHGSYMIVEDHLPGGLEALNDKLNNTSHEMVFNADGYYDEWFFWEDYGYNNKEIRADRVSFFITEMDKGKHEYTYLARATRPGAFAALPAEAYAMYNESLWGRSASGKITIRAE